jgi:hypothetical protein
MSVHELRELLDQVADTRELVLRRSAAHGPEWNELYGVWSDAHEDAEEAFRNWMLRGGRESYSRYRAAQDREDAAQDALALATH